MASISVGATSKLKFESKDSIKVIFLPTIELSSSKLISKLPLASTLLDCAWL